MAEREPLHISLRDYNTLQIDVARILSNKLDKTIEQCLVENSEAFSAYVRGNTELIQQLATDWAGVVERVADHLLEIQHQHQEAA